MNYSKKIDKFSGIINKIFIGVAMICLVVLVASCVWQVFTRYILGHAAGWTEELARYAFIWCNMMGVSVCVRRRNHATVSLLNDLLPQKAKGIHTDTTQLFFALFGIIMIYVGYQVATMQLGRYGVLTHIPMAIVYGSVFVSGIGVTVQSLNNVLQGISSRHDKANELTGEVKK